MSSSKWVVACLGVFLCSFGMACQLAERPEGSDPGECGDGADNDGDGSYDCEDADCDGSPECSGDDDTTAGDDDSVEDDDNGDDDTGDDDSTDAVDADGDGWVEAEDCDDGNADVFPGASELCDGVMDNNCDGVDDSNEVDGDGDGYTPCAGDCDDSDSEINPEGVEVCDGSDNDCDPITDESTDGDGDGFTLCDGDCDDQDGSMSPEDGEGDGVSTCGGDCDDTSDEIYPGAEEVCDALDNDCDGYADSTAVCSCFVEYFNNDTSHPYMFCIEANAWSWVVGNGCPYTYHMVVVDDVAEDDWLYATSQSIAPGDWWIGYWDANSEGTWEWESGSASTYTNWATDQPDNAQDQEDCAHLGSPFGTGNWYDWQCSEPEYYICEG